MSISDTLGGLAGMLGFIAAALVVAAWLVARHENKEKSEAARMQALEIERLKNETALAQKATEELRQKTLIPRHLDLDKSGSILKSGPKGKAVITYAPTNEANVFAGMIFMLLEDAGWQVERPKQQTADIISSRGVQIIGSGGVQVGGKLAEPLNTLWDAFQASPNAGVISWAMLTEPNAEPIRIVVGTKL